MTSATDSLPPAPPARSSWLAPLLVFVLTLAVTAMLLVPMTRSIAAKDRAAFEAEVGRTTDAVSERIDTIVTLLHGAAGLFAASEVVRRDEFAAYIRQLRLRERYPGILGIGYTARIASPDLEARVATIRTEAPRFRVWPEHPREEYHSIIYLEPLDERNEAALGYDMYTEPTRRAAMARARDLGQVAASGKVVLVQEIDERKQAGFLVYLPVYRDSVLPPTVEDRQRLLDGFVYAALRMDDLLAGVRGTAAVTRELDYELFDGSEPRPAALMRSTRDASSGNAPALVATRTLEVAGRPWLLRFTSRPGFEALSQRRLVPWLAGGSLAVALLLASITLVQARARRAAELAAAQRRRNELALQASEEQARERAERLQQLYAELSEGQRRKDEFLAVLAHELRNPLAPIRNALEILRRDPGGPAAARARDIADRQLRHMVRLVDDLLDVSRITRGKIGLQKARVRLAEVVETAVETSRPLLAARRHELLVDAVDPQLELEIDAARVAQILTNLLNNAATYTPPGGRVELRVQAEADSVRIGVRDNGIGIAPQRLAHIFELFVQEQRSPAGGGLGIGLSLAQRLAELHGGRIEARSQGPGQGAEFVLVLPREPQLAVP